MDEKRKYLRIKKSIKCEVYSEGLTFSSTIDISNGGMFISTPEPLNSDSTVDLVLFVPGSEPLSVKGYVKWVRDESDDSRAGMGVEFIDPSKETLKAIRDFIGQ